MQPTIKPHYCHLITVSHELFIQSGYIFVDESIMGDVMLNLGKTNVMRMFVRKWETE